MKYTKEFLDKAKAAESAEALQALAKENGIEMSTEEAESYFAELHKSGELSDEELENVSGGGCRKNGHLVVTIGYVCDLWRCKYDGSSDLKRSQETNDGQTFDVCYICGRSPVCNNCHYCKYEKGLWLCYNPDK